MADQPEVIQKELEETRSALAEKLEQIGEKISGTVETVTETVSDVTQTVSSVSEAVEGAVQNVAQAVSGTVETVKDTVSTVGEKASETVEAVKQAFNLPDQIRARPWLWFGGSVALGFVGGKLLLPRFSRSRTTEAESFIEGNYHERSEDRDWSPRSGNGRHAEEERAYGTETTGAEKSSWLGGIMQQFGGEINKLKGLALGTLFGVARDMVSQSLPESVKDQVTHLVDDVTEKAGGEVIHGPVLGESSQENSTEPNQESAQSSGGEHDASSTEMDRSMGTAQRKGKAAMGKSHR